MFQLLAAASISDSIDLLLRGIHNALGRAHFLRNNLGNVGGSLGQLTQQGFIRHNLGVLFGVGGSRGDVQDLQQIVPGFFLVVDAGLLHLVHHRHRVDIHGEVEHGIDRGENILVLLQIKVIWFQNFQHIRHTVAVDEHRADDGLLSLQRVGQLPGKQIIHDSHLSTTKWEEFIPH